MKTYVLLSLIAVFVFLPSLTHAAQFRSGDQVRLTEKTPIAENTYVGGGEVSIATPIQGDLFVGGGNVRITGAVQDDLFVGGGDVRIEGPVNGDLRIAGGNITITGDVTGEVMIGGGDVEITSDATVGNIYAGAGQLRVAGTTGSIDAGVGQLMIAETAHIGGNINYMSEKEADVAEGATIEGSVTRKTPPVSDKHDGAKEAAFGGGVLWYLSNLLMLLLFVYIFPVKSTDLVRQWKGNFPMNLLWGIIFLILVPIVAFLFLISILGLPIGIGMLLMYPIYLYLANLVSTLAIGAWVRSLWMKEKSATADWIAALIGLILVTAISFIPVLGALVLFVSFIAALGTVTSYDWAFYRGLRDKKTV